ncbi:hypothetical protein LP417_33885 (plasmid) [Polaromonas sp. P1-6]|nr:hypothetical protein LP417_33885 [Polaromonas sp. P1-6]
MVGVSRDFLATPGHIKLITYQALLPKLCSCALHLGRIAQHGHTEYTDKGAGYMKRIESLYDLDTEKLRIRNPEGCDICRHPTIPELNGFAGRTLAAEMVEPDEDLLTLVKQGDSIGMMHHMTDLRGNTRFDDPRMVGKTAMECAVYKMSQGLIDPRELEPRFHSFEREEMLRRPANYHAGSQRTPRKLNVIQGTSN